MECDEPTIKKACVTLITLLVDQWADSSVDYIDSTVRAAFLEFATNKVLHAALSSILSPAFDANDANSSRFAAEVALLLFSLAQARGPSLASTLTDELLPALNVPSTTAQQLVAAMGAARSAADLPLPFLMKPP